MFNSEQIVHLNKSSNDFVYFVNNIFSKSSRHFIGGDHVDETARFISQSKRTIRVSARHHFKSYAFYAYFMWKMMFEGTTSNIESHYFSFNTDLAAYHIGKIKAAILDNPYFEDIIDMKPTAESVLRFTWDRKHFTTMTPHGLVQFKRGIHGDLIFVDDPFQDPENELNPSIIYKINEIFRSNIMDMPKEPDGELHVAGTPQTDEDFYFDKKLTQRFSVVIKPAIYKDEEGRDQAIWPEWMDLEELRTKEEERTTRIFLREYMCRPAYSTMAFFDKDMLKDRIVNKDLISWKARLSYTPKNLVLAGFDIGKKSHPSHLSVFEFDGSKLTMIHQKWMDGWSYSNGKEFFEPRPTQIEYLKMIIDNFKVDKLFYDNTRGEFEAFSEQGLLPRAMEPVVMTPKVRNMIATGFDKVVEKKQIEILNDQRMLDQIGSVTSDLKAIQSTQGHGDSFWSIALALLGAQDLISMTEQKEKKLRNNVTTGQKSLFSAGSSIPAGW